MDGFLVNVGILAIAFVIVYIYKKVLEWHELKYSGFYEDEKVYKAADKFVEGAPADEVKAILGECYSINKTDIEKIMSMAIHGRTDKDGGYRIFIRSVNQVLGEDIYNEKLHIRRHGQ